MALSSWEEGGRAIFWASLGERVRSTLVDTKLPIAVPPKCVSSPTRHRSPRVEWGSEGWAWQWEMGAALFLPQCP